MLLQYGFSPLRYPRALVCLRHRKQRNGGRDNMKNQTTNIEPNFLRREDAATFLGVSERTISAWQRRRIIPHVRAGKKCVLFPRAGLLAAMERFTINAVEARR
jgi:excisionase family DNA binding protein